jgi:hypothetical protein
MVFHYFIRSGYLRQIEGPLIIVRNTTAPGLGERKISQPLFPNRFRSLRDGMIADPDTACASGGRSSNPGDGEIETSLLAAFWNHGEKVKADP